MLAALRKHYGPLPPSDVIRNARTVNLFAPKPKEPFILTAGRLWDEAKNVAAMESVAAQLAWPVYAAGDGDADTHNLRRLGKLTTDHMADHLGRASIYALPARYEPFGLSVLEAALCGCALVLSDIPSLLENWSGAAAFVPADGHRALADTINSLITDPARRQGLAQAARDRSRHFSLQRMAEAYLEAYRSAATTAGDVAPALPLSVSEAADTLAAEGVAPATLQRPVAS